MSSWTLIKMIRLFVQFVIVEERIDLSIASTVGNVWGNSIITAPG